MPSRLALLPEAGLSSPDTPCKGGWFCPGSSVSGHSPGKLGKEVPWGAQGQPGGDKACGLSLSR